MQENKFIFDCSKCHNPCDGVSKGTYIFENDTDYSERKEKMIINQINTLPDYRAEKCTKDGTDISPGLFRTWLQKTLAKVNLPKVTLHSLRHTNIALQLVAGVDMKTVSARAGHSKASTTSDFYSHFIKNSDIHASEILNKIFE